jgi:Flp pilus assembly protein protease CpaA
MSDWTLLLSLLGWLLVLINDLRQRRVPLPISLGLLSLTLFDRAWPWWLLSGLMLLWPTRRSAILIAPLSIGVGWLLHDPIASITLAASSAAWSLGYWGGADSIALTALGLRFGFSGLLLGSLAVGLAGGLVMLIRQRALSGLLPVLWEASTLQPRDSEAIPAEAEVPAAAALAVPGLVLSVYGLLRTTGLIG